MTSTRWQSAIPTRRLSGIAEGGRPRRLVIFPANIRRWLKRELGYVPVVTYATPKRVSPLVQALQRRPRSVEQLSKTTGLEERAIRARLTKDTKRYAQLSPGLWTLRKKKDCQE